MRRDNSKILGLIAVIGAVALPIILPAPHYRHIFIMVCIGGIAAISWRFVLNMGQINFGPAAFVGVGAYTSGLLVANVGISFWIALLLSGVVAAIISILIGYPTLRLRGLYFSITTFAFQEVLRTIWLRFKVPFGGPQGINIPAPDPVVLGFMKITFGNLLNYYYLALAILLITVIFFHRVDKSRFGMTLRAIRESSNLTECVGVNIMRYQVIGWAIASFFTGLSGSLYSHYILFIDPYTFSMFLSVDIIAYTIVGGVEFSWSPIIGAFILVFVSEVFRAQGGHYSSFFVGMALMACVLFFRGGVTRLLSRIYSVKYAEIKGIFGG